MNAAAEVREEYKTAVEAYIRYSKTSRKEFYEGRMSGLEVALSVLGVDKDEIRELYQACEEETLDELAQGGGTMNCVKCGIKISPSVARQQEGGENMCRDCFCWQRAREQQERLHEEDK